MKKTWVLALGLGLAVAAFAPKAVHADEFGASLNVNLGADDASHFGFDQGHHEPWLYKAAQNLQAAKHTLWNAPDHGPARMHAIQRINQALDQLRWIENNPHQEGHRRALRQAVWSTQQARRVLGRSEHGPAKREAFGYLNQAENILTRLANRPRY